MKMNKISALALGLLASAALFTGCTKDLETSTVEGDKYVGKATIKGSVYVDYSNLKKDSLFETMAGLQIRAVYADSSLSYSGGSKISVQKVVTATTAENGSFTIEVPVTKSAKSSSTFDVYLSTYEFPANKVIDTTKQYTTAYFNGKKITTLPLLDGDVQYLNPVKINWNDIIKPNLDKR